MKDSRKRPWTGNLIQNALALMVSSGGVAVIGVVFWATAAHLATPRDVGRESAEIAAMMFLANLAQLGFTTIFDRFLPVTGDRTRAFVVRAYAMCTSVALVAAIVYVLAGFGHNFIPASLGWRVLFVVSVVLWTIFVLQDSVLTGLRATRWVPVENILFSSAKIALLPVFLVVSAHRGLFLAWTTPVFAAVGAVSWYIFRKRIPRHEAVHHARGDFPSTRELVSLGAGQYAIALVSTLQSGLVTLIVIDRLGAVAEAHYYLPALISSGGIAALLWNLVTSFLVEASYQPEELRQHANVAIRAAIVVLVPSIAIGVGFAPEILRIFGATYAQHGTTLLRLLLLSLPGYAVMAFYYSLSWIDRRVWWLAGRAVLSAAVYFAVLLTLIGHFGILSVGIADLTSSVLEALLFLYPSIKRYRMTAPQTAAGTTSPDL